MQLLTEETYDDGETVYVDKVISKIPFYCSEIAEMIFFDVVTQVT